MSFLCIAALFIFNVGQPGTAPWFMERAARAETLAKDGDQKEVVSILKEMEIQAAKLGPAESRELWQSFVVWKRGVCFFWLGDYGESVATLKDIESNEVNRPFRHYLCRDLGEAYLDSGRTKQAEPYFQRALDLGAEWAKKAKKPQFKDAEHLRIQLLQVRCKLNLGSIENAKERLTLLEKGIFKEFTLAENATKEQKDEVEHFAEIQGEWRILRAETDLQDRNLVSAVGRLETGEKKLEAFPDNRTAIFLRLRCHIGLARDYWLLARFDNADAHLASAEKLVASGKLYRASLGQADIKNARAALALERAALDIEEDVAPAKILNDLDQAERNLDNALKYHDAVSRGQDMFTAGVDFQRAQLHELRGRAMVASGQNAALARQQFSAGKKSCDDAIRQLQNVLQVADNHDRVLEFRNRRAWINLRLDNAEAARDEAQSALAHFEAKHGKDNIDRGRYLHLLMVAENELRNPGKAAEYAAEHRRLIDRGLGTMLAGLSASEQVQFFRRWDTQGLNASLRLGIQHGKANPDLAASSAEWLINGKAKLAEVIAAKAQSTRASSKQAFDEYQKSVTRQAYYLYGRPTADGKIVQELFLGEETRKRDLAVHAAKQLAAPRWYSLADVQKNLRDDEVYVGLYGLRSGDGTARAYHAWLISRDGPVQVIDLGDARTIEGLVKTFTRSLEKVPTLAPGEEKFAEARLKNDCLTELSRRVLHPIQNAAAGKKRWIVSPDGPLWNIPWAALLLPDQRYAIEQMTFRYAVSGQDLVRPAQALAQGSPVVLGDPWFNAPELDRQRLRKPGLDPLWLPWDRLEYSRRECEMVLAIMEDARLMPNRMLGVMQKRQLVELPTPPRFVYLSTHAFATLRGSVDVEDPLLSCALAFAGWNYLPQASEASLPGMMTGAEVVGLDLRGTELVVLASCAGAREDLSYGQSPANLRHAFHLAGARSVVAALWGINDKSTQELMEPFIESICKQNADKADALRQAQQQSMRYMQMYRNHTHPYYWAGLTISGN
jgi:CHAT domain-containing protein